MAEPLIFGSPQPDIQFTERRAAYVVIFNDASEVARVKGRQKHFLPGGGSLAGEGAEETAIREVQEELARSVRLTRGLGDAIQYFYSAADDRHYKRLAAFFAGEFTNEQRSGGTGEPELYWLPFKEADPACFHACHAWAIRQG